MKYINLFIYVLSTFWMQGQNTMLDEFYKGDVQLIAPGIISTNMGEYSPTFDSKRNELYFMRRTPGVFDYTIYMTTLNKSGWSEPKVVSFSGTYRDAGPYLSPNGNTLYYDSKRPEPSVAENSINLWYSNRTAKGWSEPIFLKNASLNEKDEAEVGQDEFGPAVDAAGNLYYYSFRQPNRGGARYRTIPPYTNVKLDDNIPDPSYNTFVSYLYITPNGKMAFMEGKGKKGRETDLYYAIKQEDGIWTSSMPLNKINTSYGEGGPFMTSDGKYLFFTSDRPTNRPDSGNANLYMVAVDSLGIKL